MVGVLEERIFYTLNKKNMIYIVIILLITYIWIGYEVWRAPLMVETKDGKLKTIRETKKITDLWQRRS
jgi:hypothetical protein